jgi:hypothetical protein
MEIRRDASDITATRELVDVAGEAALGRNQFAATVFCGGTDGPAGFGAPEIVRVDGLVQSETHKEGANCVCTDKQITKALVVVSLIGVVVHRESPEGFAMARGV